MDKMTKAPAGGEAASEMVTELGFCRCCAKSRGAYASFSWRQAGTEKKRFRRQDEEEEEEQENEKSEKEDDGPGHLTKTPFVLSL